MMRVYLDTSVIGGYLDPEFAPWSIKLFEEFKAGRKMAFFSDLTLKELKGAPIKVQQLLQLIPTTQQRMILFDAEAEELVQQYIAEGITTPKTLVDSQHIATATVHRIDVLVSWNFKHIVNLNKIRLFNAVNLKTGYPLLEIRSPREILNEEQRV